MVRYPANGEKVLKSPVTIKELKLYYKKQWKITKIGEAAFRFRKDLKSFEFLPSINGINRYAFDQSGLTSIIIPGSVKEVNSYSFGFCQDLESAEIRKGVNWIGPFSFYGCYKLKYLKIDKTVNLKEKNFENLETVTIVDNEKEFTYKLLKLKKVFLNFDVGKFILYHKLYSKLASRAAELKKQNEKENFSDAIETLRIIEKTKLRLAQEPELLQIGFFDNRKMETKAKKQDFKFR